MPQVPIAQVPDSSQGSGRVQEQSGVSLVRVVPNQSEERAAALFGLGRNLVGIGVEMNEEHALATSRDAMNQWATYADEIDQGYRSTAGVDATKFNGKAVGPYEAAGKHVELIEGRMRTIENGLSSDLARRMFRQNAERSLVTYRGRMAAHEVQQVRVYNQAETTAAMGRHAQSYALSGDRADYQGALALARDLAEDRGMGPEARDELLMKVKTGMHVGFIEPMLEDDPKGADAYLRGLARDEIDGIVRQKLRAQIDGVLKATVSRELAFGVFDNHGYESQQQLREHAAANLPPKQRQQIMASAVSAAAKERGFSDEQVAELMKVPGDWSQLLSDPVVMRKVQEQVSSLDDDILFARYPGQPPANDPRSGSYSRMLGRVRELYGQGKIDAEQREQMERQIDQMVGRRTREQADGARDALERTEQIFQTSRIEGGPTSVYSSTFRTQHPGLFEELRSRGLLAQADKLVASVFDRQTDPAYYDQLQTDHANGDLARMSHAQLFEKYYPHMGRIAWNEAQRLWAAHHKDQEAKLSSGPVQKWEVAAKRWLGGRELMTGADKQGVPQPRGGEEQTYWLRFQTDLDRDIRQSGREWTTDDVIKWAEAREADKVFHVKRGWFWDSVEPVRRSDLQAELNEARARGDQAAVLEIEKRLTSDLRVNVGGEWVHVEDGVRAAGTDAETIPPRATDLIRDGWRLEVLRRRLGQAGAARYQRLERAVIEAGGLDPARPRNARVIEELFLRERVPAWPPVEEQFRLWRNNGVRSLFPQLESPTQMSTRDPVLPTLLGTGSE